MKLPEALTIIDQYEGDFDAIQDVLDDASLTPSEKCASISDLLSDGDGDNEDQEDD